MLHTSFEARVSLQCSTYATVSAVDIIRGHRLCSELRRPLVDRVCIPLVKASTTTMSYSHDMLARLRSLISASSSKYGSLCLPYIDASEVLGSSQMPILKYHQAVPAHKNGKMHLKRALLTR